MGRLGPLTSQALGRSPYDDVVEGEGEADPHEPERQYDEKGRIVNPETKQIIKNVIRAHNEVMLVIGVAEPDNGAIDEKELAMARDHQAYESETGQTLLSVGRALSIFGIWGVHGTRQRILVYKPYSHVEFSKLLQFERSRHSDGQLLLAGLPSYLALTGLRWCAYSVERVHRNPLLRAGLGWLRFHFHLWVTMQRLDLIPASSWLPDVKFFIPFSSSSPFVAPPTLATWNFTAVRGWLGQLAVNVAPYAAFYLGSKIWHHIHVEIWPRIQKRLPQPVSNHQIALRTAERQAAATAQPTQPIPESPTLGPADREIRHTTLRTADQDIPTLQALEGQPTVAETGIPVEAIRRQSTFSNRGGDQDYATDEEDADMINPTLISFDVDTSESNEQPAGVWSAELRPSYGVDGRGTMPKEEPIYVVNPLTSLPSILAADIFTNFAAYLLSAPFDAVALRTVALAFARSRGLPTDNMFEPGLWSSLSWHGAVNVFGVELMRLLLSTEIWTIVTVVSQWLHVTDEEWKEIEEEKTSLENVVGSSSS